MPFEHFLIAGLTLVWIDLLLAGDNALVIAMTVRHLPARERRIASICGAGLALALRVGLTFVAAEVLELRFIKLAGGLVLLWVAFQVLGDAAGSQRSVAAERSWARAMWYVVGADLTMSLDNILAIAGASGGHIGLIVFGLAVSIPFIVLSSNLLADVMSRYPVIVYAGAAILGKVAGDMALTDPWVASKVQVSNGARYLVDAALAAGVLIASVIRDRRRDRIQARWSGPASSSGS